MGFVMDNLPIEHFHWLRPAWLLLLPVGAGLLWLLWRKVYRQSSWEGQCDPALLKALLVGAATGKQWLSLAGLGTIWLLAIFALAGPAWERLPQPVYSHSQGRVLIFDLSLSMNSTDLSPSRLDRARYKLADLVAGANDRQQALVVFAGDAFVVSPFTDDHDTLINLIPSLDTRTMPVQGSRADLGLKLAGELIANSGLSGVEILLVTDGVTPVAHKIAQTLSADGHQVSVLAVGTEQGEPIPLSSGGLLKDTAGNIVVPGVDFATLQQLSSEGNGVFQIMTTDDTDTNLFNGDGWSMDFEHATAGMENSTLSGDSWIDRGAWLVLPILLLGAMGFRRGWILCALIIVLPQNQPAYAFGWQDLWTRADQQAALALNNGTPENVPDSSSPEWQGAAAFRQGNHEQASEYYSTLDHPSAHYNRGNALAKTGSLEEAIEAYQKALEQNPAMEDAVYNKKLVEDLLAQNQSSEDQSEQNQDQDQDQDQGQEQDQDQSGENQQSDNSSENPDQQEDQESADGSSQSEQDQQQEQQSAQSDQEDSADNEPEQSAEQQNKTEEGENSPAEQSAQAAEEQQEAESMAATEPMTEDQQALEQWLKQVPDDPGGLLRRKFSYQYSQRQSKPVPNQSW